MESCDISQNEVIYKNTSYCPFIDYEKAFDWFDRNILWETLHIKQLSKAIKTQEHHFIILVDSLHLLEYPTEAFLVPGAPLSIVAGPGTPSGLLRINNGAHGTKKVSAEYSSKWRFYIVKWIYQSYIYYKCESVFDVCYSIKHKLFNQSSRNFVHIFVRVWSWT